MSETNALNCKSETLTADKSARLMFINIKMIHFFYMDNDLFIMLSATFFFNKYSYLLFMFIFMI